MIILGNLAGCCSPWCSHYGDRLPLLLDCDVGAYEAIRTSARAVAMNPVPMLAWGLIVALALAIGLIPLSRGLARWCWCSAMPHGTSTASLWCRLAARYESGRALSGAATPQFRP